MWYKIHTTFFGSWWIKFWIKINFSKEKMSVGNSSDVVGHHPPPLSVSVCIHSQWNCRVLGFALSDFVLYKTDSEDAPLTLTCYTPVFSNCWKTPAQSIKIPFYIWITHPFRIPNTVHRIKCTVYRTELRY